MRTDKRLGREGWHGGGEGGEDGGCWVDTCVLCGSVRLVNGVWQQKASQGLNLWIYELTTFNSNAHDLCCGVAGHLSIAVQATVRTQSSTLAVSSLLAGNLSTCCASGPQWKSDAGKSPPYFGILKTPRTSSRNVFFFPEETSPQPLAASVCCQRASAARMDPLPRYKCISVIIASVNSQHHINISGFLKKILPSVSEKKSRAMPFFQSTNHVAAGQLQSMLLISWSLHSRWWPTRWWQHQYTRHDLHNLIKCEIVFVRNVALTKHKN